MKKTQLILLISLGLFLASIGNGAVSYLKRIGLYEHRAYQGFMAIHCDPQNGQVNSFGSRCLCMREPFPRQGASGQFVADEPEDNLSVYRDTGHERWLKIGKDALFAGFMLISLFLMHAKSARLPALSDSWPALLLAVNVAVGFAISLTLWGATFALIGLRSFEFLAIVLLGGWIAGELSQVARFVGWLLVVQATLVVLEMFLGMPLRTCPDSFRAAGTMVLSNSLGIFTVVALAFYTSFSQRRAYFAALLVATVILLLASGSGTGLIALFVLLAYLFLERLTGSGRRIAGAGLVLLAAAMLVNLPALTQRPDIYDSLLATDGRVGKMTELLRESSAAEILIGRGVGFGTNTASNLVSSPATVLPTSREVPKPFSADSTLIVLLTQLGIVGIITFYWLLGWAFWRDPKARLTYLVIAIVSLTINITEVFPVNFLLGLALAHTIAISRPKPA